MDTDGYWGRQTRDRWFFAMLSLATAALAWLFSPFLYVLLFAAVLVVVTWPVYQWVLQGVKGRRALAAPLTLLLLGVVVFGPVGALLWVFVVQAARFGQQAVAWVQNGGLNDVLAQFQAVQIPMVEQWLGAWVGEDFSLISTVAGPLQRGLLTVLETAGTTVPGLITGTVGFSIDLVIFLFASITLYMEGPRLLDVIRTLSPMEDRYEAALFKVFREFANNMVIGSLATGALQGLVAGIGYAIAGAPSVVFLAICTGVFSFVPLIGTSVIWLPVVIYTATTAGWGWALFLAIWSLAVTGSVDNFVKPMFLRGSSDIHPLLIFLGVFGGLSWMGVPGVLIGPVIVAFFLALYTIYKRDFLGGDGEDGVITQDDEPRTTVVPPEPREAAPKPPEQSPA